MIVPIHGVYGVDKRGNRDYSAEDDEEGDRLPGEALPPDLFHHFSGSTLLMRCDDFTEFKQIVWHQRVDVLVLEATEEIDKLLVSLLRVHQDTALPQHLGISLALQQPSHTHGVGRDAKATSDVVLLERNETLENTFAVIVDAQRRDAHHAAHSQHLALEYHVQGVAT